MYRIVLSLGSVLLLLQFSFALSAQQRPDFSGTWVMDPGRSASYSQKSDLTLMIEQTPEAITIEDNSEAEKLIRTYKLDRSENIHEGGVRSRARFDGDRLVITSSYPVRTIMGEWWVNSTVVRSLASGGNELVAETTVSIDHGYTFAGSSPPSKSTDVFVKKIAMDEYLEN